MTSPFPDMSALTATLKQKWRDRHQNRIYILPTKAGYAYAGLVFLLLLGAINYNNSMAHMLCFLLASLGQIVLYHTHRNIRQISIAVTAQQAVFYPQPAQFDLHIINHNTAEQSQLIIAHQQERLSGLRRIFSRFQNFQHINILKADNEYQCQLTMPTQGRGWCQLNPLRLSSTYPLGLFSAWTLFDLESQVLVYPQARGDRPLPISNGLGRLATNAQLRDDNNEFSGLKNYRQGESLQRVAWKALARDDIMRSKQFSTSQGVELMLRWQDLSDIEDSEQRLSQLCRWIVDAESIGYRYGLILPRQQIAPARGSHHQHQCLKALALYEK